MQATTTRMYVTTSGTSLLRCCATMGEHLRRYHTDDEIRDLERLVGMMPRQVRKPPAQPPRGSTPLGRLRVEAGLMQAAVATRLGVHPDTVAHWEVGSHPLPLSRCHQLADLFGVPLADVLAAVATARPAGGAG